MANEEEIVGDVISGAGRVTGGVITGTTGLAGDVVSGVTGGIGSGVSQISGGIGGAIGGPIGSVIGGVGGVAGDVIGGVGGLAGDLVGGVGGLVGGAVSGVTGAIGSGVSSITSGIAGAPPPVELPPPPGSGGGKDPCNRLDYLKDRIGSIPVLGNLSLKDIGASLDNIVAPKIPEIKIPSPKDIIKDVGDGISGGIKSLTDDLKSGISGALNELSPDNLMAGAKQAIGLAGREALTNLIEDKMMDALGPAKGGLGNQLKRSFKANMMMAGITEVANIISGEPNILDPCAGRGKEKLKGLTQDTVDAAKSGKIVADLKGKMDKVTAPETLSLKELNAAQTPVLGNPALPGAQEAFEAQKKKNDEFTEKKVEQVIKETAKETAEKAVTEEEAAEQQLTNLDNFAPVTVSGRGLYMMDVEWVHKGILENPGELKANFEKNIGKMKMSFYGKESATLSDNYTPGDQNETKLHARMWIQEYSPPWSYITTAGNPWGNKKPIYVGGFWFGVDKLYAGGSHKETISTSESTMKDHANRSYLLRVYNIPDMQDGAVADYYVYNATSYYPGVPEIDLGALYDTLVRKGGSPATVLAFDQIAQNAFYDSKPFAYYWNPDDISRLSSREVEIIMTLAREHNLDKRKATGLTRFIRNPLVWTSYEECVDGLIDWFKSGEIQIPVSGDDVDYKQFPVLRRVNPKASFGGTFDIPSKYYSKVSVLDLMDHELYARTEPTNRDPKPYKPTQASAKRKQTTFRRMRRR